MKILYIADVRSPHTRRLMYFFADAGHDIMIYDGIPASFTVESCRRWPAMPLARSINTDLHVVHHVIGLMYAIRAFKPDVIHGHYLTSWGLWAAMTGFRPLVESAWGSDVYLDTQHTRLAARNAFAMDQADLVTADSRDLAEQAVKCGARRNTVEYVLFGIDTAKFSPGPEIPGLRARLGIPGGVPVILSSRQWKPGANIDVFLKAIPVVLRDVPQAHFLLVTYLTAGSEYDNAIRAAVAAMPERDRIHILADLDYDTMRKMYSISSAYVSLRDTDASSCSVLEAMASGIPVVTGNIPSMQEWIENAREGFTVNQRDPDDVAEAILASISMPSMGLAARNRVVAAANCRRIWGDLGRMYARICQLPIGPGQRFEEALQHVRNARAAFEEEQLCRVFEKTTRELLSAIAAIEKRGAP